MSFRPPVSELSVDFHKLFSRLFRFMSLLVMGIMCLSYSPVFQIPICQIESSHSAVSVLVLPLSSVLKYSVSNWKEVVDDVIMWPDSSVTVCVDEVMAYKRTLMYVANALHQQADAADAETRNCKPLHRPWYSDVQGFRYWMYGRIIRVYHVQKIPKYAQNPGVDVWIRHNFEARRQRTTRIDVVT